MVYRDFIQENMTTTKHGFSLNLRFTKIWSQPDLPLLLAFCARFISSLISVVRQQGAKHVCYCEYQCSQRGKGVQSNGLPCLSQHISNSTCAEASRTTLCLKQTMKREIPVGLKFWGLVIKSFVQSSIILKHVFRKITTNMLDLNHSLHTERRGKGGRVTINLCCIGPEANSVYKL